MPSDHPTKPPPSKRPSGTKVFRSATDSKKIDNAQGLIIENFRSGVKSIVDRFFDEAKEVVRSALLHVSLDVYNEGIARGSLQTSLFFHAYLKLLDQKYAETSRDPRVEPVRPSVSLEEMANTLRDLKYEITEQEVEKQCREIGILFTASSE